MSDNRLKTVYLFIGPPGSGKGTITSLCVNTFGWGQLSTGNLCRKHIVEQTEVGQQIDFALKSGKLVPDSLIASMVNEWFVSVASRVESIILDGYPRTVMQANYFHRFIRMMDASVDVKIVKFNLHDDEIIQRLCSRYTCSNKNCQAVYSVIGGSSQTPLKNDVCDRCQCILTRRSDDTEDIIKERLQMYHRHEQELIAFYQEHNYPIAAIDVNKSVESVFLEFKKLIELSI